MREMGEGIVRAGFILGLLVAALTWLIVWLLTPARSEPLQEWPEGLLPTYCLDKYGIPLPACIVREDFSALPSCDEGFTLLRYPDNFSLVCARDLRPAK